MLSFSSIDLGLGSPIIEKVPAGVMQKRKKLMIGIGLLVKFSLHVRKHARVQNCQDSSLSLLVNDGGMPCRSSENVPRVDMLAGVPQVIPRGKSFLGPWPPNSWGIF